MRPTALLPAALLLLFCLANAAPARAAEPFLRLPEAVDDAPQRQPEASRQEQPAPAQIPLYMDRELAREHERFTEFATGQLRKMNENIIGGRHAMQVSKHHDGRYHASYKAIDLDDVICQVRRSESNPQFYMGSVLYKEIILESVGDTAEDSRNGQFVRVSERPGRIIYSSKRGGGWQ